MPKKEITDEELIAAMMNLLFGKEEDKEVVLAVATTANGENENDVHLAAKLSGGGILQAHYKRDHFPPMELVVGESCAPFLDEMERHQKTTYRGLHPEHEKVICILAMDPGCGHSTCVAHCIVSTNGDGYFKVDMPLVMYHLVKLDSLLGISKERFQELIKNKFEVNPPGMENQEA